MPPSAVERPSARNPAVRLSSRIGFSTISPTATALPVVSTMGHQHEEDHGKDGCQPEARQPKVERRGDAEKCRFADSAEVCLYPGRWRRWYRLSGRGAPRYC